MAKYNFSTDEQKVLDLTLDLARNEYSAHIDSEKLSRRDLENYLRDKINKDILKGMTMYQAMRRNNIVMFEIMEELVDIAIVENVFNSPFVDTFVEIKNRGLGDTSAFYSEGGLLHVAAFAGNHWDTNRQTIDLGEEITLPKEWLFIHVYDELERFLLGITSLDRLMDKVYKSVNKYIQDRIYLQFQSVANSIPSEYSSTGNTEAAVGGLCDVVAAAGGYSSLTIAGTKGALRKLANVVPDKMFANSQKEAKAMTGSIGDWEGNTLMVIPQTLKSGTRQVALDDSKLFIMGADVKPIKLEWFGDVRTKMDTTGQVNGDQTMDFQLQAKFGIGLLVPNAFGVFTMQ
jgi:hypothetical protein